MMLLVGGEKGGTGKTTLAVNLASMRACHGRDVLLVDTDPQGSASYWAQTRVDDGRLARVSSVQKFGKGLVAALKDLSLRYEDVIVDAGGRDSVELRAALIAVELALLPVQASQFDLWTLERLSELVDSARAFNPNLKASVVISRASTNANNVDAAQARELLSEYPGLAFNRSLIRDRLAFRRSAAVGQGVAEHGEDEKAIFEVKQLFKEVFGE